MAPVFWDKPHPVFQGCLGFETVRFLQVDSTLTYRVRTHQSPHRFSPPRAYQPEEADNFFPHFKGNVCAPIGLRRPQLSK